MPFHTLPPSKTLKYKKYRFFRDFNGLGRDGREGMGGRLAQCMKRLKVFSILLGQASIKIGKFLHNSLPCKEAYKIDFVRLLWVNKGNKVIIISSSGMNLRYMNAKVTQAQET